MSKKKALIFGCTGQDASYLAELLLEKDYDVTGVTRRSSSDTTSRIKHIRDSITVVEGDVSDFVSVSDIVFRVQPDEIYNLAAQSHVATSFQQPSYTWRVNAEGPLNILESVRRMGLPARVYQASSSEEWGSNIGELCTDGLYRQSERTALAPNSPYAIAKVAAHHSVRMYRDAYGIFACAGLLTNHESPRRGENFVTRKITKYIGDVVHGRTKVRLKLGNIYAKRDWSHAKDFTRAMWMMLQQEKPKEYVIASGECHSVEDFLVEAFSHVGWDWHAYVEIDPSLFRASEVPYLCGNPTLANNELGWFPTISFKELVKEMVDHDVR